MGMKSLTGSFTSAVARRLLVVAAAAVLFLAPCARAGSYPLTFPRLVQPVLERH
jgi:hypothetical protein